MTNCGGNTADYLNRWVKLNVGGTTFLTTRTTLARYPNCFLYRLCQEDSDLKTDKDESGAYLIERNPNYFAPILDFLRHGELIMDQQVAEEGVLREAEFFGLPELAHLVQLKIQEKSKARMVELKMVEEWRMEEQLKLEQELGINRKKAETKREAKYFARIEDLPEGYDDDGSYDMAFEMFKYIRSKLSDGWKLDEVINLGPQAGVTVIMSLG